jgi:hypothetical protein
MPLKSRIKPLLRALPKALDQGAQDTAKFVLNVRNGLVPEDTGALRESGEILAGSQLGHWIVREGAGLPDARAAYTEYGTDKAPAQPHMTPAAEQGKDVLKANVAKRVSGVLK